MTTPQPGPYLPPPPSPKRKRHILRWTLASIAAFIVIIVVAAVALGPAPKNSGHSAATTANSPAATAASTPKPTPSPPPALPPGQAKFVSDLRAELAAKGDTDSDSNSQVALMGKAICTAREGGASEAAIIAGASWPSNLGFTPRHLVRLAEKDICPSEIPVVNTVTYIVTGTGGADVTYGPAGDFNGQVPMNVTANIPSAPPVYYAINAQLQGEGTVSCTIEVNGQAISTATASGGYNIAGCEIGQDPITGQWQNDNDG